MHYILNEQIAEKDKSVIIFNEQTVLYDGGESTCYKYITTSNIHSIYSLSKSNKIYHI